MSDLDTQMSTKVNNDKNILYDLVADIMPALCLAVSRLMCFKS